MNETLEEKLQAARSLIDEVLRALGSEAGRANTSKGKSDSIASVPKTLGEQILVLREKGFFKEPRTQNESYEKVHEEYYCERKPVGVELFRLYKKRQLRKVSKEVEGKKLVAYVW